MPRPRVLIVVPHRALSVFAGAWLALLGCAAVQAQELGRYGELFYSTAQLEPWQLIESDPEIATEPEVIDESLPMMTEPSFEEDLSDVPLLMDEYSSDAWQWRWLPEGLIYRSYWAGVHEPRMALVAFYEASDSRALWDATLGGRVGMLQFGNGDPFNPTGFQIDFYGAAIARLDVENEQDLDSTDYVFGVPLTWGDQRLQHKVGYAHISSHLGDEFAIRNPGSLNNRINYVRDSLEFGTSYYWLPAVRVYGEIDWAFHRSGGAEPLALEFGSEVSRPGPTGGSFTPFAAINTRMREEHDFGGDVALQAGWLRRGLLGQTLRLGGHYYNGKSSQFQFFRASEEQIGMGVWYDF